MRQSPCTTTCSKDMMAGLSPEDGLGLSYPSPMIHAAFHRKVIDKYDQNGEVTGMLLSYPACMIHMLEVNEFRVVVAIFRIVLG